jgi:hypothetical protein
MAMSFTLALSLVLLQQAPGASPADEVVHNLKAEPVGTATLDDLGMPEEYLQRVAGRILRGSFEQSFRVVVADETPAGARDRSAESAGTPAAPESHGAWRLGFLFAIVIGAIAWIAVAARRGSSAP